VVDSGASEKISHIVRQQKKSDVSYKPLGENLGFNAGLNAAVEHAITNGFDWLATMTVRAKPYQDWLAHALLAVAENTGMVTTLHLDNMDKVDCLGHNLGPDNYSILLRACR